MPTYTYTTLDDPSGRGQTFAYGINGSGQVVGTYFNPSSQPAETTDHGFLYSSGTYTTLDYPANNRTDAYGINDSGEIVGYYSNSGPGTTGSHGFLYSGGSYTSFDYPPIGGILNQTFAQGINDADQIVGYYLGPGGDHGFLYSGGNFTTLDVNGSSARAGSTVAHGINASGQIVGEYVDSGGTSHGFLYSGGTYTTLTDPFAINGDPNHTNGTVALGINDAGQIVGYYYGSPAQAGASPPRHGFIYSGGIYTTIDDPSANFWGPL
jgi:probable HAF family extracellular repeat protein